MEWMIIGICACSWFIGLMSGIQYRDWQYGQVRKIEKELREMDIKHGDIMDHVKSRELTENLNIN